MIPEVAGGIGLGDIAESVSGSEIIGPEGDEYSISGVNIIVPEGTLSKDVEFYVREVSSFPQLPQENSAQTAGKAFEINTSDSIGDSMPVEVVLPLDGSLQDSPDHYTGTAGMGVNGLTWAVILREITYELQFKVFQ